MFRSLKTDLGLRPVFHRTDRRVEADDPPDKLARAQDLEVVLDVLAQPVEFVSDLVAPECG